MQALGYASVLANSDLRRARNARVLVCGSGRELREVCALLKQEGIAVRNHPYPNGPDWVFSGRNCDVALCYSPRGELAAIDALAQGCREHAMPCCVMIAKDDPQERLHIHALGVTDVVCAHWSPFEIAARMVRLLADQVRLTHARCVHATLRKRMSDKNRQLDWTRLEMVHRLGRAAEYRDNETGQHVIRVGLFCEIIGRRLAMPVRQVQLLRHASPLHDIGKIGVADAILLKSGPLCDEEWTIMKQHTVIGAEILAGTDDELLEMARVIALTHHERWDGQGYPAGLSGEDIPMCGRIASVCDVYDALTSDRPYKKRWSRTDALAYLKRGRGTQFDPDVVNAFVASLSKIRSVQHRHSDNGAPNNVYCGASFPSESTTGCNADWIGM